MKTPHESSHEQANSYHEQVHTLDLLHLRQAEQLEQAGVFDVVNSIGIRRVGADFVNYPKQVTVFHEIMPANRELQRGKKEHTGLLVSFLPPTEPVPAGRRQLPPTHSFMKIDAMIFDMEKGAAMKDALRNQATTERSVGSFVMKVSDSLGEALHLEDREFTQDQIYLIQEMAREKQQFKREGILDLNYDLTQINKPESV